jgi:hypothetical protein
MKKLALIITLIGLTCLFTYSILTNPVKISSLKDLKELNENQKVRVGSKVLEQKYYDKYIYLKLENNLTLIYSGKDFNFINKEVEAQGIYDSFNYPKIRTTKIIIKS